MPKPRGATAQAKRALLTEAGGTDASQPAAKRTRGALARAGLVVVSSPAADGATQRDEQPGVQLEATVERAFEAARLLGFCSRKAEVSDAPATVGHPWLWPWTHAEPGGAPTCIPTHPTFPSPPPNKRTHDAQTNVVGGEGTVGVYGSIAFPGLLQVLLVLRVLCGLRGGPGGSVLVDFGAGLGRWVPADGGGEQRRGGRHGTCTGTGVAEQACVMAEDGS